MEITAPAQSGIAVSKENHARRQREPLQFRCLAWSLFLLDWAVILVGLTAGHHASEINPQLLIWVLVVMMVDLPAVPAGRSIYFCLDLPILLAAGFIFGPIAAGLVAFFGSTDPREFRRCISLSRAIGNRAQVSLSVMAAAWVFQISGGQLGMWPRVALCAVLALLADVVINYSLAGLLSGFWGNPPGKIFAAMLVGPARLFVATYISFGLLGLVVAELYTRIGLWTLAVAIAPVFICRQAFSKGFQLEEADRDLQVKTEALSVVSKQISQERADERQRIASSLHDDVMQSLHGVTIHAEVIKQALRNGQLLQLEEDIPALVSATQEAADLTRAVIRDLRGSPIGRGGVAVTLRELCRQVGEDSACEVRCDLDAINVTPFVELLVYQVGREALVNSGRYSGCTNLGIQLHQSSGVVSLCVEDDGNGFDLADVDSSGHFGLQLMRERVALAGGNISIDAEPGRGVKVTAEFPAGE